VVRPVAVLRQLGDELQRQHRLPGPGAAADDEGGLLVELHALGGLGDDGVEHDALLVEQDVRRLLADHAGGVLEQLLVRPVGAGAHALQDGQAAACSEAVVQEAGEVVDPVAGEQRVHAEDVGVPRRQQLGALVVQEVVQERARAEPQRPVGERGVGVGQVVAVLPRLHRGVQDVAQPAAVGHADALRHG
jgi:hypothetical protein